jgi:hypothetical protein
VNKENGVFFNFEFTYATKKFAGGCEKDIRIQNISAFGCYTRKLCAPGRVGTLLGDVLRKNVRGEQPGGLARSLSPAAFLFTVFARAIECTTMMFVLGGIVLYF